MILAIIQARMGSSRLAGKVLMDLAGKTVIEHVYNRVRTSKYIDDVVIATSLEVNNLPLVRFCADQGYRVFCGSENNVLDRFYQVAKLLQPSHIVRITADCPLHDASVIDKVIAEHLEFKTDYTSNCIRPTYPDGLDVEIFTYKALENAWQNAKLPSEIEHVTPYIIKTDIFNKHSVINSIDYSCKRWTLDEERDFEFISRVYNNFYPDVDFGFNDILNFIDNNGELEIINSDIVRNEGMQSSLKKDSNNK